MKNKDFFNYLIYGILISFIFEPNVFFKFKYVNFIYILGLIFSFIFILIKNLKILKNIKIPKMVIFLVLWMILMFLTTIIHSGDVMYCGYKCLLLSTLLLYSIYFDNKNELNFFVRILYFIFTSYLVINLISYLFLPSGFYVNNGSVYFLGIRTRFTEYVFGEIMLAITAYKLKQISKFELILSLIVCLLNVMLPSISTACIGMISIPIGYFIFVKLNEKFKIKDFSNIIIITLTILTLAIVFFRVQNLFSFLIVDILHKDITLTGRTNIWDIAFETIKKGNMLIGNGYSNGGNFVKYGYGIAHYQAHNQWLQLLYECGFTGMLFFILAIKNSMNQKNEIKYDYFCISMIFSVLIMMITEIYSYHIAMFVVFIICNYRKKLFRSGEQNEN